MPTIPEPAIAEYFKIRGVADIGLLLLLALCFLWGTRKDLFGASGTFLGAVTAFVAARLFGGEMATLLGELLGFQGVGARWRRWRGRLPAYRKDERDGSHPKIAVSYPYDPDLLRPHLPGGG